MTNKTGWLQRKRILKSGRKVLTLPSAVSRAIIARGRGRCGGDTHTYLVSVTWVRWFGGFKAVTVAVGGARGGREILILFTKFLLDVIRESLLK